MPHRYLVRWQDGRLRAEYEVKALNDGILFYAADPTVTGGDAVPPNASGEVEDWLRARFGRVEVDQGAKPGSRASRP